MINIKGHDFRQITVRSSHTRRGQQYKNKIINSLKRFGLTSDDVDVPLEVIAMKRAQASASWYMFEEHLFFSYNKGTNFVENLSTVFQVIEYFLSLLDESKITSEEFVKLFVEDVDIMAQRKAAREVLGVDEKSNDFETIHKNYKKLSKEHHPDMPKGDTETFKKLNVAHKVLKKELIL
ncbi:MAG: DnaJ domain-containing protein [Nanoarchaeota archaeon]|nr:DnaJ domain-containing protein [Nanoarchaeota archaeon]